MGETNSDVPCLHRSESHELHFLSPKQATRKIIGINSGSILLIYEFKFISLLDLVRGEASGTANYGQFGAYTIFY